MREGRLRGREAEVSDYEDNLINKHIKGALTGISLLEWEEKAVSDSSLGMIQSKKQKPTQNEGTREKRNVKYEANSRRSTKLPNLGHQILSSNKSISKSPSSRPIHPFAHFVGSIDDHVHGHLYKLGDTRGLGSERIPEQA